VKKWIATILLAGTLLALALATHLWGARVIKFAVDNDKTVDALKKLLELLLAIAGIVPPVIKVLFGGKEKDSNPAPTVTNSQAAHDLNTAGRDVQTGGTRTEHDVIGRDSIGRDKIETVIYQTVAAAPTPTLNALHQLPPPPADFTGRTTELAELRAAIEKGGIHISGLQGQGGVGKTALALKLAEDLTPNYPDAQIYLDLKGVSEKPLTAAEAMSHVLRTFHPEAKLPEKEEDLRAQYLSTLHNKRALLLMDNAKDAAQVRLLIPPPDCALLVTSRARFHLPGLQPTHLDTLPPPDARDLLLEIASRIGGEADAIANICGYLPLALRLAATAIAEHADLDPAGHRKRLADEKTRLKLLAPTTEGSDPSVEASITLSYKLLDGKTQTSWRTLAVFPDTFDASAAAAVWENENDAAQDALSRLLQLSMLEWNDATKRYRLHDLMRDFALQRLTLNESDAAAQCHAGHYGAILATAEDLYRKGGESLMSGLALFDIEWGNIQAGQTWIAAHAAQDHKATRSCSNYPDLGTYLLLLRLHPREQISWRESALTSARQLKDRAAEGVHLGNLGLAYARRGDYSRAIECHEQHLVIARETGARRGEGDALGNLGNAYHSLGDASRAIEYYEKQLEIARETGSRRGEGNALGGLGNVYGFLGKTSMAIEYTEKHLAIAREIGDRQGEGNALGNLGTAYHSLGEASHAIENYQQQLAITRDIGDRRGEGAALWNMSLALDKLGDHKKAIEIAEAALKIKEQIEDPGTARVRKQLAIWKNG
jgi:tetratricopeptide (TPR) repeat protein